MTTFVISGAGTGAKFAAGAVAAIPGAKLIGICAPSETRRKPLCQQFGAPEFSDFTAMLRAGPDVIILCSPNHVRVAQFKEALAAGADTLLDKPLATSEDELDTLMATAKRERDRFCGALLQHSFNPGVLAATRFIKEGFLGVPISAQISVPWGRFGSYLEAHYRAANNDGVVLNQSPHAIQAALQITAATINNLAPGQHPVLRVCGTSNRNTHFDDPRCETETTAVGTFILTNGVPINYSLTAGTNVSGKWTVKVLGRDGEVTVREDGVVLRMGTRTTRGSDPDWLPDWIPLESKAVAGAPDASSNAAGSGSSYHQLFIEDFLRRRENNRPSGLEQLVVGSWSTSLGFAMLSTGNLERITTPRDYSALLKD